MFPRSHPLRSLLFCATLLSPALSGATSSSAPSAQSAPFLEAHCFECHDSDKTKGGLNLATLSNNLADPATFSRWVKIHDRIQSGEMPPPDKKEALPVAQKEAVLARLKADLIQAEAKRLPESQGRTRIRRLTRTEYENTVRDLFSMPGIALKSEAMGLAV